MHEIYLDNSATTRPCKATIEKMIEVLTGKYGNPSSLHGKGLEAEQEIEMARGIVAKAIDAEVHEIFFTSGGTEANNLAILGAAEANKRKGNKIVTTAVEHSSVFNAAKELEKNGYEVVYLTPSKNGEITVSQLKDAIDEKTALVSVMCVNNEVGSLFPVESLKAAIKRKRSTALLHIDAVQAFGKIPLNVDKLGADLLSVSAHKIHGPKGVGALYVRKGVKISPRMFGGEQQQKLRPGTEAVPLIAGFGAAVQQLKLSEQYEEIRRLNDLCRRELLKIDGIEINSPDTAIPHILNVSTNAVKSETMLHFLSSKGIFVSSGSACAKGKKSRVLTEMGLSPRRIDTALRISFSRYNTKSDVEELVRQTRVGMETLAHI